LIHVRSEDIEKLLTNSAPEIKKAIATLRWLQQIAFEAEDMPLVFHGDEDLNDTLKEVTLTQAEGECQLAPDLLPLGIWEMAQDYPRKLSG